MATFNYKAQNAEGKIISGSLSAASENELHEKLKSDSMMLLEAQEVSVGKEERKRLKLDRLSDFFQKSSANFWLPVLHWYVH